jgi:hypothetical protein
LTATWLASNTFTGVASGLCSVAGFSALGLVSAGFVAAFDGAGLVGTAAPGLLIAVVAASPGFARFGWVDGVFSTGGFGVELG